MDFDSLKYVYLLLTFSFIDYFYVSGFLYPIKPQYPCTTTTGAEWVRHPMNCSVYFVCGFGIAHRMQPCPYFHVWSKVANNCVPRSSRFNDCIDYDHIGNLVEGTTMSTTSKMTKTTTTSSKITTVAGTAAAATTTTTVPTLTTTTPPTHVTRSVRRRGRDNYYYPRYNAGREAWNPNKGTPQRKYPPPLPTPPFVIYPSEPSWNPDEFKTTPPRLEPAKYPEIPLDFEDYGMPSNGALACGIAISKLIIGGSPAAEGRWPWMVSLRLESLLTKHVCGAALIHPQWVATAAHCVYGSQYELPSSWRAVLGEFNLNTSSRHEIIRKIDLIERNPNFRNGLNYPNDIALMRLDTPVDMDGVFVRQICIPTPDIVFQPEDECWIMGWGETSVSENQSDILRELRVGLLSQSQCRTSWGRRRILNSHICAGNGHLGACNGDSGGPLVCRQSGYHYLVGITSWGVSGCQTSGYPSVYSNVAFFSDWIEEKAHVLPPPLDSFSSWKARESLSYNYYPQGG